MKFEGFPWGGIDRRVSEGARTAWESHFEDRVPPPFSLDSRGLFVNFTAKDRPS